MLETERILAERLGWSLHDMDRTDIESLIPFVFHLAQPARERVRQQYADQVDWL